MKWMDEIIIGLLETYGTGDPYEIFNVIDIEVIKVDKDNKILLNNNCLYVTSFNSIFIRNDLNPKYEMFYLRHELGHIILHLDSKNMMIRNNAKIEKEANYFAFKLSSVNFDEVELYEMTLEQIACCLELPYTILKQLSST